MAVPLVIWALGALIGAAFGASGCGSSPSSRQPDRDEPLPDEGTDGPGSIPLDGTDGGNGTDADAMPPARRGIHDNWAEPEDCLIADLVPADEKLYALCEGNPHRLIACEPANPQAVTKQESAVCDDFVSFEEAPHLNGKPLTLQPLVHNVIDDRFSVVTFDSVPDHHAGFFVVDRETQNITDRQAWETPGIQTGDGLLEFPTNLLWGTARLGDTLVLAARNRDFESDGENYLGGLVVYFDWNGDGTVAVPEEGSDLGLAFLFASGLNSSLLWKEGSSIRVLNNAHRDGKTPQPSGWDTITLVEGRPSLNADDFVPLGPLSFESFKHFASSPDSETVFLTAPPNVYLTRGATSVLSEPFAWRDERVVSAAWVSAGQLFFAGESQAVFGASAAPEGISFVSDGISLIGEPAASAFMDGIYYQAEIRDRKARRSAITAMLDSVFDVE